MSRSPLRPPLPARRTLLAMLLLLELLLAGLAGCAGCRQRIPLPAKAITDPLRLRDALVARYAEVRNARGEAKVELFSAEGYTPFSQVLVVERPARLHIEALSPFDAPLGIFTCDGERFQLYDLKEQRFYHGPATPENMARLLPLPLPPTDLVEVLLGSAPLLPAPTGVAWDEAAGHYLLMLALPEGQHQVVRLDPRDLTVLSARVETAKGRTIYLLEFDDFAGTPAGRLPRSIHVEMPAAEVDLTLSWKEREVNVEIPAEAWSQEPPRGARIERLP
ncbi:MAG: DUF4292 domain-containing protein [Deltaproteobacteria bacterium]|nr:DUF4292 domain-containing protein [Deltaproteobacteria bacterium]